MAQISISISGRNEAIPNDLGNQIEIIERCIMVTMPTDEQCTKIAGMLRKEGVGSKIVDLLTDSQVLWRVKELLGTEPVGGWTQAPASESTSGDIRDTLVAAEIPAEAIGIFVKLLGDMRPVLFQKEKEVIMM